MAHPGQRRDRHGFAERLLCCTRSGGPCTIARNYVLWRMYRGLRGGDAALGEHRRQLGRHPVTVRTTGPASGVAAMFATGKSRWRWPPSEPPPQQPQRPPRCATQISRKSEGQQLTPRPWVASAAWHGDPVHQAHGERNTEQHHPPPVAHISAGKTAPRLSRVTFRHRVGDHPANRISVECTLSGRYFSIRISDRPNFLCRKQHRKYRGVGVGDRVDAHPAHHRGDGPVGFCLHPSRPVFESEIWQSRQQYASRRRPGAFRE